MLANPPFHPAASAGSPDPGRDRAHREGEATLADWIDAGLRRLLPGGRLVLVHRTARLGTILAALEGRAGAVEILPIASRAGRPAARVLVRARKARAAPLTLWPPLTFHEGDAHAGDAKSYTVEAQRVLRGMAELLPDTRATGSTLR